MRVKKVMKKFLSLLLVLVILMGFTVMVSAEEVDECPAAPDVAGQILEDNDIDFRYEAGTIDHPRQGTRILYSNYVAMVAQQMANGAAFPAYLWNGSWDGETYVEKCDVDDYYLAVYNYLRFLGADLDCQMAGVLDPVASGVIYTNYENGTGTLVITVKDKCGNGIEGLTSGAFKVTSSSGSTFYLSHSRFTLVSVVNGVYTFKYAPDNEPVDRVWEVFVNDISIQSGLHVVVTFNYSWGPGYPYGATNELYAAATAYVGGMDVWWMAPSGQWYYDQYRLVNTSGYISYVYANVNQPVKDLLGKHFTPGTNIWYKRVAIASSEVPELANALTP